MTAPEPPPDPSETPNADSGWLYPPVPWKDLPPEPPHSRSALALLGVVVALVVIALAVTVAEGQPRLSGSLWR
jgi:hypothetical protein